MELLCPSCQRQLTIPDQFAGQPAKCPLCNNTFTAPALPTMPALTTPSTIAQPPAAHSPDETLALPSQPPPSPAKELPGHVPPPNASASTSPAPSAPITTATAHPSGTPTFRFGITFSPRVLPWLTAGGVVLVFLLTFFTWVGFYPGGVPVITQSAWQAAFGSQTVDRDLEKDLSFLPTRKEDKESKKDQGPGASGLLIIFLLLLIPSLMFVVGVAVLEVVHYPLPPVVSQFLPWRWGIVALVLFVLFFFLGLQLLTGLALERSMRVEAERLYDGKQAETASTAKAKEIQLARGAITTAVQRTTFLKWSALLLFLAFVFAGMQFWIERSPHRPLPRIEFRW